MRCTNCQTNLRWVEENGKRYLHCDVCKRYWTVENGKAEEVNLTVKEYTEKYKKPESRRRK